MKTQDEFNAELALIVRELIVYLSERKGAEIAPLNALRAQLATLTSNKIVRSTAWEKFRQSQVFEVDVRGEGSTIALGYDALAAETGLTPGALRVYLSKGRGIHSYVRANRIITIRRLEPQEAARHIGAQPAPAAPLPAAPEKSPAGALGARQRLGVDRNE